MNKIKKFFKGFVDGFKNLDDHERVHLMIVFYMLANNTLWLQQAKQNKKLIDACNATSKELMNFKNYWSKTALPQINFNNRLSMAYFDALCDQLESLKPGITNKVLEAGNEVIKAWTEAGIDIGTPMNPAAPLG